MCFPCCQGCLEPSRSTPSLSAEFEDVFGYPYGGKGPRQPDNVYFTVTVKNLEEDEPYDIVVQSSVKDSGDDQEQSYVDDGDIGSSVGPGQRR
jgi:hypothetical protein